MPNKTLVLGHNGMVGSAICRHIRSTGDSEVVTIDRENLDLLDQKAVERYLKIERPDQVYLAAAHVGGIHANDTFPVEFLYRNLMIQNNVISSAYLADIQDLLFLGSSCIYPRMAIQPIAEEALLTGPLEPTNEPYAIAKIAGIKLCESYNRQHSTNYRSVMPTNLYGPFDNFHPENSHVIPGMMNRFAEALKSNSPHVDVWGSGSPKREFLFVDDMAAASVHVLNIPSEAYNLLVDDRMSHINVGTGVDCTIHELANALKEVSGFRGDLLFDTSKPDGTPRKVLDVGKIQSTGWSHTTSLHDGLKLTWEWYMGRVNALL